MEELTDAGKIAGGLIKKKVKKPVAIFMASLVVGMAIGAFGLWGEHALLANFMGPTMAVAVIVITYVLGIVACCMSTMRRANGDWLIRGWLFDAVRRLTFCWVDAVVRSLKMVRREDRYDA